MVNDVVEFSGEEIFWLARLCLECDELNTYVLDKHVFNGVIIKSFTNKRLARLETFRKTGCKSDIARLLWDTETLNQQRHDFFSKLVDYKVLKKVFLFNRIFYEVDEKRSFDVFKDSSRGKIIFGFFDKNCTIIVE